MSATKIRLSKEEMELVTNADWILTKNAIIEKAKLLLAQIQTEQKEILDHTHGLPQSVISSGYKISKGENYLGLPYLILDHPRYFSKDDVFAIRTFFWWGRMFSITLHLAGDCKIDYTDALLSNIDILKKKGFFICVNESQWEHHFDDSNYRLLETLSDVEINDMLRNRSFLKLAQKFPITDWDQLKEKMAEYFAVLIRAMQS